MPITSISDVAPISFSTALTPATSATLHPSSLTATASSTPTVAASTSAPVSTPAATASFSSGAGTGTSSSSSDSSSAGQLSLLDEEVTYSTTVAGRSYVGSVAPTDGQYEATVVELPGANATGASVDLAEANLNNIINFLV